MSSQHLVFANSIVFTTPWNIVEHYSSQKSLQKSPDFQNPAWAQIRFNFFEKNIIE